MHASERPRVLVVDGDEQTLAGLRRLLRGDYDVTITTNWEHGLELLAHTEFAVVIVNDALPWLGGVEFLQRAHSVQPHTCRILMGQSPKNDRVIQAINHARIHCYVCRPWQGTAFKDMLAHEIRIAQQERRQAHEHSAFRQLLVDEATGLPSRALMMETLAQSLRTHGFLAAVWLDAQYAWSYSESSPTRHEVLEALRRLPQALLRRGDVLVAEEVDSPHYCVFLAPPRDDRVGCAEDAETLAQRLRAYFRGATAHQLLAEVQTGVALVHADPRRSPRAAVQELVSRARAHATQTPTARPSDARISDIRRILAERCVRTLFQPIATLDSRHVMGFEALSRGPTQSPFESPEALLNVAEAAGLSFELDRLLRTTAMTNAVELPVDKKIFVNTLASTAHDPDLATHRLCRFLRQLDIHPSRLVLEFSERCNIGSHGALLETVQQCRSAGVGVAIDDVGAGYSGLERIVALHPNYLKIDRSLVVDLHKHPVKRSVLAALVSLADTLGAEVIAEGIEQNTDALCLAELGVKYGQGFLLGRPTHPTPMGWGRLAAPLAPLA